jgi:hypothetical protein
LYINNAVYLRITNNNALTAVVSWSGQLLSEYGLGASRVASVVGTVGALGSLNLIPVGAEAQIEVSRIGASVFIGIAPAQLPDVDVFLNDGTLTSLMAQNSDDAFWAGPAGLLLEANNFLTVTDTGGAGGDLGISAIVTKFPQV